MIDTEQCCTELQYAIEEGSITFFPEESGILGYFLSDNELEIKYCPFCGADL